MNALRQIWALSWKELRILATDRTAIVTLFVLPTVFLLVMSLALSGLYNRNQRPRVLAINQDQGIVAGKILARLERTGTLELVAIANRQQAEQRLRNREAVAALIFAPAFSAQALRSADPQLVLLVDPAAPREVVLPVQGAISGAAARTLAEVVLPVQLRERFKRFAAQSSDPLSLLPLADAFEDLKVGEVPIQLELPAGSPPQAERPNSLQQNVPAWTIFGLFFIVNTLALSILREREMRRNPYPAHRRPPVLCGSVGR